LVSPHPCIFCEIVAHRVPATIVFEDASHLASFPPEHVHLVPVYAGDELNPLRAKALPASEAERLSDLLREAFGA
jgi:diadenosine tetraphosphate (Ap4A) HIT family hydrolase